MTQSSLIPNENHEMNWAGAAKSKGPTSCPFEYAAQLTEVMILGIVARRAGKKIEYEARNMRGDECACGERVPAARAEGWVDAGVTQGSGIRD